MSTGYNKIVRKYKSVFGYYVREQYVTVAFICCMLSVLQLIAICCPPDPQQQTQARKQEMKLGVVKSGPFLNAGCIMYSISIFYFTFYLLGDAPPPPTGLIMRK